MEYVAQEIYKDFENINLPNKEDLITQGSQQDVMELLQDLFDHFDERFSKKWKQ